MFSNLNRNPDINNATKTVKVKNFINIQLIEVHDNALQKFVSECIERQLKEPVFYVK